MASSDVRWFFFTGNSDRGGEEAVDIVISMAMNHRAASRAVSKIATPKNGAASCGVFTSRESGIKIHSGKFWIPEKDTLNEVKGLRMRAQMLPFVRHDTFFSDPNLFDHPMEADG